MITIVEGDLLNAKENYIVHQVNCQAVMKSGIADQIKKKYPEAYNDYIRYCRHKYDNQLLGKVLITKVTEETSIVHLFGQLNYGYTGNRYTSYDSFYDALKLIKETAKANNKTVALPYKIGSDRGGADWNIIKAMIESVFNDYAVTIYKYTK